MTKVKCQKAAQMKQEPLELTKDWTSQDFKIQALNIDSQLTSL